MVRDADAPVAGAGVAWPMSGLEPSRIDRVLASWWADWILAAVILAIGLWDAWRGRRLGRAG
jgi:hypothetical protein